MPKCTYCGKQYEWPRGLTLVKNDGKIIHLCSSKCRKNRNLGRNPKKLGWIKTAGIIIEEEKAESIAKAEKETLEKEKKE